MMQVFDLADVKPHEFVRYGLKCLEMLAGLGDSCAKETRERIRVLVCSLGHIKLEHIFAYWSAVYIAQLHFLHLHGETMVAFI